MTGWGVFKEVGNGGGREDGAREQVKVQETSRRLGTLGGEGVVLRGGRGG